MNPKQCFNEKANSLVSSVVRAHFEDDYLATLKWSVKGNAKPVGGVYLKHYVGHVSLFQKAISKKFPKFIQTIPELHSALGKVIKRFKENQARIEKRHRAQKSEVSRIYGML